MQDPRSIFSFNHFLTVSKGKSDNLKTSHQHHSRYGEGNEMRLTGEHETCDMNTFKFGVANRGCSIRIPRETAVAGKGYMEDRRPAANCDPYRVTARIWEGSSANKYVDQPTMVETLRNRR